MRNKIFLATIGCFLTIHFSYSQDVKSSHQRISNLLSQMKVFTSEDLFAKAYKVGTEALAISEKNTLAPDSLVGAIYDNLGRACIHLGQYQDAKKYFDKYFEVQEKVTEIGSIERGMANYNLGLYYDYTNELELAINHYEKSISIYLNFLPKSRNLLSKTYYNMAICFAFLEDYEKAIRMNHKALEMDYSLYGPDDIEIAFDLNNLGILYYYIKDYKKALSSYIECKRILKKNGEGNNLEMARLNLNIGSLYNDLGEYEESKFFLKDALRIYSVFLEENDHRIVRNYWILATVFLNNKEFNDALEYLDIAAQLSEKNSNIGWETEKTIYYYFTKSHLAQNNLDQARATLTQAMDVTFPDRTIISTCKNGKKMKAWAILLTLEADLWMANYEQEKEIHYLEKAAENYQEALVLGQKRRATFQSEQSKESWLTKRYALFEKAIACQHLLGEELGEKKYFQQAFNFAEQSKALLLLDALQKTKAEHFAGIPDSLLQQEKKISESIANLEQEIFESNETDDLDSQAIVLQGELFELQQNYDSLVLFIGEKYPRYSQLQFQRQTVAVTELQKELTEKEAILQYFVGDSSLFIFYIDQDEIALKKTLLDFPLNQWVSEWRKNVEAYGSDQKSQDAAANYVDLSRKLYEKLLAPFASQLPPKVTIVADGVLGYLPFEALLVSTPKEIGRYRSYDFFLHHHQLSYAFSTSWSQEMNKRKSQFSNTGVLAMAPVFGSQPLAVSTRFSGLDALRYNQKEVKDITKIWGGKSLTGMSATETAFYENATDYQILHLATHAKANDQAGDFSFLAFSEILDSIENEMLYTRELYECTLNADLVVLSACETGVGELQRGEGVISLARGFSYAGARSIVTTLWRVSDSKAAQLMTYFYESLREELPKDQALQKSKIDYLTQVRDRDAHPFYWAAFIPLGNMDALSRVTYGLWWGLGIGLLGLLLGGLAFLRFR